MAKVEPIDMAAFKACADVKVLSGPITNISGVCKSALAAAFFLLGGFFAKRCIPGLWLNIKAFVERDPYAAHEGNGMKAADGFAVVVFFQEINVPSGRRNSYALCRRYYQFGAGAKAQERDKGEVAGRNGCFGADAQRWLIGLC